VLQDPLPAHYILAWGCSLRLGTVLKTGRPPYQEVVALGLGILTTQGMVLRIVPATHWRPLLPCHFCFLLLLRCGLDVFEDEPAMKPGLADCPNAVIVPHIASASFWTRSGMVCGGVYHGHCSR
jgi:hypothetical protein